MSCVCQALDWMAGDATVNAIDTILNLMGLTVQSAVKR